MDSNIIEGILKSQSTLTYLCIGLSVSLVILASLLVMSLLMINALKKRYESFMKIKTKSGFTIDELLDEYIRETRSVSAKYSSISERTLNLEKQIRDCFQKIGIVRYNPFDDTGGDLSYVIALLDNDNNGFVLNGIFNRSGSHTYAKEIENGVCVMHKLSAEELEAIRRAQ